MINLPPDVVLDKLIRTMNSNTMFELSTVPNELYGEMGKARVAHLPVSSKGGRLVRSLSLDPMVCVYGVVYMRFEIVLYLCSLCAVHVSRISCR